MDRDIQQIIDEIFVTCHRLLYLCAARIVENHEDAQDIVNDVYLKLSEKNVTMVNPRALKAYICRCVRNYSLDYLKHRTLERNQIQNDNYILDLHQNTNDNDLLSELIKKDSLKELFLAIEQLPPKCREIFLLVKIEDWSYKKIAKQKDITVNTVHVHVKKAMKFLRHQLKKNDCPYLYLYSFL